MKHVKTIRLALVIFVLCILIGSGFISGLIVMLSGLMHFLLPGSSIIFTMLSTVLLIWVIGALMSMGLSNRVTAPLTELTAAHKRVSQGDFSVRVDETASPHEIRELQQSFNRMAEDLGSIEMFRNDFINSFSHEFKTPIVSIRGFARQLQRGGLSPEQEREYIDIIVRESERLSNLSVNILMLTKVENQQIVTDKVDFHLDELLRDCILTLEKRWTEKALELDIELESVNYHSNTELMSQMWLNLLDNAIKFSPQGGTLGVSCRREGDNVLVTVSDNGAGMDAETQKYIFQKFYQGDSSHASSGNGIGLAIVSRVAELCGGSVSVKSALGKGSAFTVTLPAT